MRDENGWETKSSSIHYADDHLVVVGELVKPPTKAKPQSWTTVRRKTAVVIAPMMPDGKLLLIREERIPVRATIWSVPAGQIDDESEKIEMTALRELREETGYELAPGGEIISLGLFYTSPGLTNECCHLMLARYVRPAGQPEDELIVECRGFSPNEVARMIAQNEIRDSNTLAICARMAAGGYFSFNLAG
jgi:8-oxo-dGTP pyrophosphatase MutT (NUDIX family)